MVCIVMRSKILSGLSGSKGCVRQALLQDIYGFNFDRFLCDQDGEQHWLTRLPHYLLSNITRNFDGLR